MAILIEEIDKEDVDHPTFNNRYWLSFISNSSLKTNTKLHLAKENNDNEGMFTYKRDFNERADSWDENTWSKRLCFCIQENVLDQTLYQTRYTASEGTDIYHDKETCDFYRFHGSPDLLIHQKN